MVKLVILIRKLDNHQAFDEHWPEFLHQAEQMPGLISETTSQVENLLYGSPEYIKMHELFFESMTDLSNAMTSPHGKAAGSLLQRITGGRMNLFTADHKADELENIRKYTKPNDQTT